MTLVDRSRIIAAQTCRRLRFLNYEALGTGIVPVRTNVALSTGSAIHKGVELLLLGKSIDIAVGIALGEYEALVNNKELDLENNEEQLFVFNEQKALIEALIRVYYKIQLPLILQEYEVLEVEKEILFPLIENKDYQCPSCDNYNCHLYKGDYYCDTCLDTRMIKLPEDITLMSKPDAILRDKSTGGLVVYSLKSSSSWNDTNEKQNKYDDQGISELIATEYLLGEEVEAIKMDFLIKGSRTKLKDGDVYRKLQNSFLIHPYKMDTGFNDIEFRLDYTRAKGWSRCNIWEVMSIKEWVDFLFENNYEALAGGYDKEGNKSGGVIVSPYVYNRSLEDIEDWIASTRYQEQTITKHIQELWEMRHDLVGPREDYSGPGYRELLNRYFPKNRRNCYSYGSMCQFVDICWSGIRTTSVEYEKRTPHHLTELELFQIQK